MLDKFNELYKFIKIIISQISEVPIEKITDNSNFQEDLEMDSLEAVEILHKIEKKYKIKLRNIDLEKVQTLGDIFNICKKEIFK